MNASSSLKRLFSCRDIILISCLHLTTEEAESPGLPLASGTGPGNTWSEAPALGGEPGPTPVLRVDDAI